MNTYQDYQLEPQSEKIGLVVLNNSVLARGWSLHSGSIYKLQFERIIASVEDSGVALVSVASIGLVTAGKYFHDRSNGYLYIRTSDSVNPNGKYIVVESSLFFSNVTVSAPYDLGSGSEVNWLPMLAGTSDFGVGLDNQQQFGLAIEGSGKIELINDSDFWAPLYDKVTFENKKCLVYSWNRSLPVSEAKLIYRGLVERKSWSSKSVSFSLKDTLSELRGAVQLEDLGDHSGTIEIKNRLQKQRLVYGRVYGHRPQNIDEPVGNLFTISGTVTVTGGSASVTGIGTAFFDEVSPGDQLAFGDDTTTYSVDSIASDTSLTLTDDLTGAGGSGLAIKINNPANKRYLNRTWLIAGHPICEPSTAVTGAYTLAWADVSDSTDFRPGDLLEVGSELTRVGHISGNRIFWSTNLTTVPPVSTTVTRIAVSRAWIGSKELVYGRDFTVNASTSTVEIDPLAEFNVAPILSVKGTSITITSGLRSVTGYGTSFESQLKPGDWVKVYGQADYFEISSVESDTALTLKTAATYTATGDGVYKHPNYLGSTAAVLSVDCLGKTGTNLSSGSLLSTGPHIVQDLLYNVGFEAADLDLQSFDDSAEINQADIGLVVPTRYSETKSPKVRDVINKVNQSVLGSLIQTNDFKLKYSIISPKRTTIATKFSERDVLSFKITSDSAKIVKTVRVNWIPREYDQAAEQSTVSQSFYNSNAGEFLIKTTKEYVLESLLVDQDSADIMASRLGFLFNVASSVVKIDTKLKASQFEVNDLVEFTHEKMYERVGSSIKTKVASVNSVKKTIFDSSFELEDLSNAYSRCGVITPNTYNDWDTSTEVERLYAGYITDNYGMQDNDPDTNLLSLIW